MNLSEQRAKALAVDFNKRRKKSHTYRVGEAISILKRAGALKRGATTSTLGGTGLNYALDKIPAYNSLLTVSRTRGRFTISRLY